MKLPTPLFPAVDPLNFAPLLTRAEADYWLSNEQALATAALLENTLTTSHSALLRHYLPDHASRPAALLQMSDGLLRLEQLTSLTRCARARLNSVFLSVATAKAR